MNLPVQVKLSSIFCYDEADGIGNAEPYLWTIFFKIDGETIKQNGIKLTGDAVFFFGPGSHENLNTHSVVDGESVKIPPALGEWKTTLQPIILEDFNKKKHPIPGIIGVAVVLMEEDNVSNSGAEAGHQALNNFIRKSINDFIHGISLLDFAGVEKPEEKLKELTTALIKDIKENSEGKIKDAIRNKQPWYNDAWAFVNKDDNIGSEIWLFNQDEIVKRGYTISLRQRWKNEGDWEIFGTLSAPDPCLSFVSAINVQTVKIAAIKKDIARLRGEMRKASVSMRAELQAEIDQLNISIKSIELEIKRLQQLLLRCRTIPTRINETILEGKMATTNVLTNKGTIGRL